MKYRVVGWTDYDSDTVPEARGRIGYAECCAIIDEIKKHGYLFSGWDHQECLYCVPVLNDGKKRCFSQRGWGGIMAEAYGETGDYSYAQYTFDGSLDPAYTKKPTEDFDPYGFTPDAALAEHFTLPVDDEILQDAQTNNPFRIKDADVLRYIDTGDTLTLCSQNRSVTLFVTDIDRTRDGLDKTLVISYDSTKTIFK